MKHIFLKLMILGSLLLSLGFVYGQEFDIELDLTDSTLWTIDEVHLGTRQIKIGYDSEDSAVVMHPTWAYTDTNSTNAGISNIENGKLHTYQHIDISDCTQSEVHFEINIPQEYIEEGKLEFVFSLQAGAAGDYLFNGHTYKMSDFANSGGNYKKMIVLPADYHEDLEKLRKIERVNIIFERKGSFVSAPIKIRNLGIYLHKDKILPPVGDKQVINPKSFYEFKYHTPQTVNALEVRVSAEAMNITRRLNDAKDGMALIPMWGNGQIPTGHTGDVVIVQHLGAPHDFEPFETQYVFNIPQSYIDENKIQFVPFVQAGAEGFWVWSGVSFNLKAFAGKANQDVVVSLSTNNFITNPQKKKNLIEMVGFKIDRHGSTLTDPIILKSITIRLDNLQTDIDTKKTETENFSIFPNPASSHLTIVKTNDLSINQIVKLYDPIGKLVYQSTEPSSLISIDVSNFIKGIYFLKIENEFGDVLEQRKILISK